MCFTTNYWENRLISTYIWAETGSSNFLLTFDKFLRTIEQIQHKELHTIQKARNVIIFITVTFCQESHHKVALMHQFVHKHLLDWCKLHTKAKTCNKTQPESGWTRTGLFLEQTIMMSGRSGGGVGCFQPKDWCLWLQSARFQQGAALNPSRSWTLDHYWVQNRFWFMSSIIFQLELPKNPNFSPSSCCFEVCIKNLEIVHRAKPNDFNSLGEIVFCPPITTIGVDSLAMYPSSRWRPGWPPSPPFLLASSHSPHFSLLFPSWLVNGLVPIAVNPSQSMMLPPPCYLQALQRLPNQKPSHSKFSGSQLAFLWLRQFGYLSSKYLLLRYDWKLWSSRNALDLNKSTVFLHRCPHRSNQQASV